MMDDQTGVGDHSSSVDGLIEIDLNFESMRRFQAEFSPNLSKGGLFIDTGEPLSPGAVVRFRVILPEEFIFLEGTAVVEWIRRAEDFCDGGPGMALRFVTLSTQNQELVEQLVQDHVDAGGSPFDLDVQPVAEDYPTDALEGAPLPSNEAMEETYRLTVRRMGPSLESEALQALTEATPDAELVESSSTVEIEEAASLAEAEETSPAEVHGFEIVSSPAVVETPDEPADVDETPGVGEDEVDAAGDPPEFDWSAEIEKDAEPDESKDDVDANLSGYDEDRGEEAEETTALELDVLPTPAEFDDGPVVIDDFIDDGSDDVTAEDLGSPAFDVSLPEPDDEPDTTPVLPDEGHDHVTVPTEDEEETPRRRRRWPLGLAAVFLLALAGGFLWPHAKDWYATRNNQVTREPVAIGVAGVVEESVVLGGEQPTAVLAEAQESSDEDAIEPMEAGDQDVAVAQIEPGGASGESTVEEMAEETQPETVVADVELAKADAVTAIDIEPGPRGTVIRIRGNGSLEDGVISMETLPSPPRVLIRVRGITSGFRPYTIESSAVEVSRIRSGLHEERRPSELWIVVDLTGPDVALDGINIRRDVAELVLTRP